MSRNQNRVQGSQAVSTSTPVVALEPANPAQMLALAVEKNLDIEKMRELMALEKEWRADKARAEYAAAMARFGDLKKVIKHNRRGTTAGNAPFSYSDFSKLVDAVTPWLSECGLSFSHRQDKPVVGENGSIAMITVYCKVMHAAGHFEEIDFPAIPDARLAGKVSPSQLIQLAITYAKRQTLSMALGIATSDDASDSDSHGAPKITEEQEINLEALITEVGADKKRFLHFMKIEKLGDLPADKYENAVKNLERKRSQ